MQNYTQTPPRSAMEVFKMLPEGTLCEVIKGQLFMSPSPFTIHQMLITELLSSIHSYVKLTKSGHVFTAPFDVYLDEENNAVQPDIIVILKENEGIIKDHIHGVPDIIIEILSEGNINHDLIKKKELYEMFAVKEYFIVDPRTKLVISYEIQDGKFMSKSKQAGKLTSALLHKTFDF